MKHDRAGDRFKVPVWHNVCSWNFCLGRGVAICSLQKRASSQQRWSLKMQSPSCCVDVPIQVVSKVFHVIVQDLKYAERCIWMCREERHLAVLGHSLAGQGPPHRLWACMGIRGLCVSSKGASELLWPVTNAANGSLREQAGTCRFAASQ